MFPDYKDDIVNDEDVKSIFDFETRQIRKDMETFRFL